jgi:hypothetical protein
VNRKKDLDDAQEERELQELLKEEQEADRQLRENTHKSSVEEIEFERRRQRDRELESLALPSKEDLRIMNKWKAKEQRVRTPVADIKSAKLPMTAQHGAEGVGGDSPERPRSPSPSKKPGKEHLGAAQLRKSPSAEFASGGWVKPNLIQPKHYSGHGIYSS